MTGTSRTTVKLEPHEDDNPVTPPVDPPVTTPTTPVPHPMLTPPVKVDDPKAPKTPKSDLPDTGLPSPWLLGPLGAPPLVGAGAIITNRKARR